MTVTETIEQNANVVYNEDCIQVMKRYPNKFFDLAVVDPPYGIGIANRTGSIGQRKGQGRLTSYSKKEWDNSVPTAEYWSELFRVSKNQIVFGANYFTNYLPPSKCWFIWDKRQPEGVSFAMVELIYTSFNFSSKMFSCSKAFIGNKVANNKEKAKEYIKLHPTQKPIQIYDWIFSKVATKGIKVLDTHLGSGSSRISANKAKLHFVGCEIDEEYFNKQNKRYEEFVSQARLW